MPSGDYEKPKRRLKSATANDMIFAHAKLVARVRANPNPSFETQEEWIEEYRQELGEQWAAFLLVLVNSLIPNGNQSPLTQITANQVIAPMHQQPNSTSVTQTAGRDQIGTTAGTGNMVEIRDIKIFSEWIDEHRQCIEPILQQALKEARLELENAIQDRGEREAVIRKYQELADEAVKKEKDPTVLKMAWGAITSVITIAKSIPAFVKVGEILNIIPKSNG